MKNVTGWLRDFATGWLDEAGGKDKALAADRSLKQAKQAYRGRVFDTLQGAASESIRRNPDQRDAYIVRGMDYLFSAQAQEAVEDFTEAIRLSSQHTRAYFFRALAYVAAQEYALAVADLDEAIRLHKQFVETLPDKATIESVLENPYSPFGLDVKALAVAYAIRGDGYRANKDFRGALDDYAEAIRLNPDLKQIYHPRATDVEYFLRLPLQLLEGDNALGSHLQDVMIAFLAVYFDEAIARGPNKQLFYFGRGWFYDTHQRYEFAIRDFTVAITLEPNFSKTYHNRGTSYIGLGQHERAIADFTTALRLNPRDERAYINRGCCYLLQERFEEAVKDFTNAIHVTPRGSIPWSNRANVYNEQGDYKRALADANKALSLNPQHGTAYSNRGWSYLGLGRYDLALSDLDEAIRLKPDLSEAYLWRGMVYQVQQGYEEALADYEMALSITTPHQLVLSPKYRGQAEERRQQVLDVLDTEKKKRSV